MILAKNKNGVTINGGGRKHKNFKRSTAFKFVFKKWLDFRLSEKIKSFIYFLMIHAKSGP